LLEERKRRAVFRLLAAAIKAAQQDGQGKLSLWPELQLYFGQVHLKVQIRPLTKSLSQFYTFSVTTLTAESR
jgi:hypothetical protein